MRVYRFTVDCLMFFVSYTFPPILALYALLHFKFPHLVLLTKRLDQFDGFGNVRLWN